jgi:hypothetical protein
MGRDSKKIPLMGNCLRTTERPSIMIHPSHLLEPGGHRRAVGTGLEPT